MTTILEYKGNAAEVTLAGPIDAADLAFTVTGVVAGYPDGTNGAFVVCIGAGTGSMEKILCDSRAGASFTVNAAGRGFDGTTATSHAAADKVTHVVAAQTLTEASAHVGDTARDDHTQYAKTDGSRAITGAQTFQSTVTITGAVTLVAGITVGGDSTLNDGVDFAVGTVTGTKIGTGATQKLGFFGATPIVRPSVTGSRGANAALASLLTQLAALGLITDSTTA